MLCSLLYDVATYVYAWLVLCICSYVAKGVCIAIGYCFITFREILFSAYRFLVLGTY